MSDSLQKKPQGRGTAVRKKQGRPTVKPSYGYKGTHCVILFSVRWSHVLSWFSWAQVIG